MTCLGTEILLSLRFHSIMNSVQYRYSPALKHLGAGSRASSAHASIGVTKARAESSFGIRSSGSARSPSIREHSSRPRASRRSCMSSLGFFSQHLSSWSPTCNVRPSDARNVLLQFRDLDSRSITQTTPRFCRSTPHSAALLHRRRLLARYCPIQFPRQHHSRPAHRSRK